jgi:hypothetical protein
MRIRVMLAGLTLTSSLLVGAQVAPSNTGGGGLMSLSAGGVFSVYQTDANHHPVEYAFSAYSDYTFFPFWVWRWKTAQFNETNNIRQDAISSGLRYIYNRGRFAPYAKALGGLGSGLFPRGHTETI